MPVPWSPPPGTGAQTLRTAAVVHLLLRRHRSTAFPGRLLKLQVARVGLEPTTGGL
jgi:hypothetical protein